MIAGSRRKGRGESENPMVDGGVMKGKRNGDDSLMQDGTCEYYYILRLTAIKGGRMKGGNGSERGAFSMTDGGTSKGRGKGDDSNYMMDGILIYSVTVAYFQKEVSDQTTPRMTPVIQTIKCIVHDLCWRTKSKSSFMKTLRF